MASAMRAFRFARTVAHRTVATHAVNSGSRVVRIAHILVKPNNKEAIEIVVRDIASGKPFGELARQHSACPTAKQDGEVGWLQRGVGLPRQIEEAVYNPDARIGDIVRADTQAGHHFIKLLEEREMQPVQHMSPEELAELLKSPAAASGDVQLVDVREPWEAEVASLPGFKLYPTSQVSSWPSTLLKELDPRKETIVLCHHGVRSMQAAQFLAGHAGFTCVKNLTGGIDAYSLAADPSVPRY